MSFLLKTSLCWFLTLFMMALMLTFWTLLCYSRTFVVSLTSKLCKDLSAFFKKCDSTTVRKSYLISLTWPFLSLRFLSLRCLWVLCTLIFVSDLFWLFELTKFWFCCLSLSPVISCLKFWWEETSTFFSIANMLMFSPSFFCYGDSPCLLNFFFKTFVLLMESILPK